MTPGTRPRCRRLPSNVVPIKTKCYPSLSSDRKEGNKHAFQLGRNSTIAYKDLSLALYHPIGKKEQLKRVLFVIVIRAQRRQIESIGGLWGNIQLSAKRTRGSNKN
uniref:Uncharacterized protein n=1 Tax=Oryza sativa subsp. japonica TaxID=39947 RepID=Q2R4E6_ORYSJ|nr:hypothetical protein LOC_Os11g28750 [Oryza sativa Japonica Group]